MASVVLLSGGLDSLVAAWAVRETHPPRLAITFDYSQRAATREIESALAVCAEMGLEHRLVKLPWMVRLMPALSARFCMKRATPSGSPSDVPMLSSCRSGISSTIEKPDVTPCSSVSRKISASFQGW